MSHSHTPWKAARIRWLIGQEWLSGIENVE
jgi:hypothetical protein